MKQVIFKGAATALYTPITNDEIDYKAFGELIERQIDGKIDALAVLGTTGEAATITPKERNEIIKFSVKAVNKRVPLIVGTGSNCTKTFISRTQEAKELGADCALAVTPYYNKCNAEGLFAHFSAADKSCSFPVIVYNVPSRTGMNVSPETYAKLSLIPSVVGIKEADTDVKRIGKVFKFCKDKLPVYCGSDEMTDVFCALGASGTISVLSNIIPFKIHDYILNFEDYYEHDENIAAIYKELSELLFIDINPIPLKTLVKHYFKCGYDLRLPLTELSEDKAEYLLNKFSKLLKKTETCI